MQCFCSCWHSCSDGFTNFLVFLHNGPYAGFIHLDMVGICSCRLQSMVHTKQFSFLKCHDSSRLLGKTFSITSGTFHSVIQALWHCTKHDEKYTRIMRSLFTVIPNLLEVNCSRGNDYCHTAF